MRSVEEDYLQICCNLQGFADIVTVGRLRFPVPGIFRPHFAMQRAKGVAGVLAAPE